MNYSLQKNKTFREAAMTVTNEPIVVKTTTWECLRKNALDRPVTMVPELLSSLSLYERRMTSTWGWRFVLKPVHGNQRNNVNFITRLSSGNAFAHKLYKIPAFIALQSSVGGEDLFKKAPGLLIGLLINLLKFEWNHSITCVPKSGRGAITQQ